MNKHEEKTLVLLSLVCLILAVIFKGSARYFIGVSMALQVINLFIPSLDRLITKAWLGFSEILGKVNTRIILTLIWYVFLVPLAFLKNRNSGEDLLIKNPEPRDTFWVERNIDFDAESLKKSW